MQGLRRVVDDDSDDAALRVRKLLAAHSKHLRLGLAGCRGAPGRAPAARALLPEALQRAATASDSERSAAGSGAARDAVSLAAQAAAAAEAAVAAGPPEGEAGRAAALSEAERAIAALRTLADLVANRQPGSQGPPEGRTTKARPRGGHPGPRQPTKRPRAAAERMQPLENHAAHAGPKPPRAPGAWHLLQHVRT